jgi:hypothetical protein
VWPVPCSLFCVGPCLHRRVHESGPPASEDRGLTLFPLAREQVRLATRPALIAALRAMPSRSPPRPPAKPEAGPHRSVRSGSTVAPVARLRLPWCHAGRRGRRCSRNCGLLRGSRCARRAGTSAAWLRCPCGEAAFAPVVPPRSPHGAPIQW